MIPNKSNFKFQELTPITGVKPYVLRFWEAEFDDIAPVTSDSGQKLYARKDVEAILKIKKLLFDEKLSIHEAKAAIKSREIDLGPGHATVEAEEASKHLDKAVVKNVLIASLHLIREVKIKHKW